ncbi:indole-3-glycerol phosphate synthase TrpC [Pseudolactococcus carnosus]|uniref:Indole-3-glycerol phosphate synthase n=1 Tax=Pseudolactococcus carnosus TaxID=2749961 RepID=A0ABT0ARK3_9LACT|nr:indole-3-glycerol phosphate synthase TrpC [Lactococcus carnosus]SCA91701.1 Indole-3-glycerol phosphate synthase [Lactococcus piscium]MCJ1968656.1 indole-3-glycerol phosphate synthase TrpC [Lactococcus carnosus]MCJ1972978.1 indole-3-glycerol phosphate synthase TrpC [Lactococcus carnosus]MCJ1980818.1 indole-3-glycerol phosphate synthase TrpC [Lactococcus carnosus]MCJ1987991.1 indole-3-glycerol phosphate synthase TrpC [Lactococcus carnosus]
MENFLDKILAEKRREVDMMVMETPRPVRQTKGFVQRLREDEAYLQVIGEVKRASPSLGAINMTVDVLSQAKSYETAGVSAISVLTDPVFFKGSIDDLRLVADNVSIPVLNKDFIIDKKQIVRAVNSGATIVLLIVACLSESDLQTLYQFAISLGLEVLVEVHNAPELEVAHRIGAELIGVNNRNLKTFEVSLQNSLDLVSLQQADRFYISESGIKSHLEAEQVAADFRAVLVGEALMKDGNPTAAAKQLQVKRHVD